MKRYPTYHLAMAAIAVMTVALFSCKDDEDPVIPVVSFQAAARTVGEDAGTIDVVLQLDVDAPREIKVRYTLSGTASEGTTTSSDFQVLGTYGEVTIPEGSSTGTLQLQIKDDVAVEVDETVVITINDVVNDAATIGATPATTITLQSNDLGAKVAFTTATQNAKESDGTVTVNFVLDAPAGQELTVDYSFNNDLQAGMALDSVYGFNEDIPFDYYDFYAESTTPGKLTIPAGSTTASITLSLISDFRFDNGEKIEITINSVSAGGQVGAVSKQTITLAQEDGKLIGLIWDPSYTDVDMDLFLWAGADLNSLSIRVYSIVPSTTTKQELLFIPKLISDEIDDLTFGLSYVYYQGTANPMNFEVHFADYVNGTLEALNTRDVYPASYTLANINAWDTDLPTTLPKVEQTFKIVAGAITNISTPITVPTAGSRQSSYELPAGLRRGHVGGPTQLIPR